MPNPDPDHLGSRIGIRIKVKSRIRIKVTSRELWTVGAHNGDMEAQNGAIWRRMET